MSEVLDTPTSAGPSKGNEGRGLTVLAFSVLVLGILGTTVGIHQLKARPASAAVKGETKQGLVAPRYATPPRAVASPNLEWRSELSSLKQAKPELYPTVERSEEALRAARATRASRRAYDGAPPVVPHPITQYNAASCLVCHEKGLDLGATRAPPMSHRNYVSCTQCHAPPAPKGLVARPADRPENSFQGLESPGPGSRAGPGAPPVIPHSTRMRESCTSCHGPLGLPGLRTTHPWRVSCVQCHAASKNQAQ